MITRKRKICKACNTPQYIFSHGLCRSCYGKHYSYRISSRSAKRKGEEKEYKRICREIDHEAKEKKQMECFFCGLEVVKCDHHHLDGRDGARLTKKKWIKRVHRKCHQMFHDWPKERIPWYGDYLKRLKQFDFELYRKELLKTTK